MQLRTTIVVAHGLDGLKENKLTGNVIRVHEGDAVEQAERLADLQVVFGTEFDRGELTVDNLRPVLWAAHWLKAVRPVAQRASELLSLAADRVFEPGSKAARDCDAVGRVMASVATTEPHCLTAIEAARKIRVPADFYAADQIALSEDIATSALRVDGIRSARDLSAEESQEISRRTRDAYVAALGLPKGMPASHPDNCPDCDAIPTSPHGCGRNGIHEAGQSYDDSPFRIYGFAHEMLEVLQRINIKVAGRDAVYSHGLQPSEQMLAEADSAMEAVWVLLDKIAGRGPMEMDPESAAAIEGMIRQAAHQERQANTVELQQAIGQLKELVSPDDQTVPTATSIIEQRVRERAQRRYQREVMDAFFALSQFCGSFEPVINGKPYKAVELLQDLERQCYEQGKKRAGDNAVEDLAATIAYRLEDLLGGAA